MRQRENIKQGAYFNNQQGTFARKGCTTTYKKGKRCHPSLPKRNNGAFHPAKFVILQWDSHC